MSTFEAVFVMFRETNVAKSHLLNTNGFAELFLGGKTSKLPRLICAKFISHDKDEFFYAQF